MIHIAQLIMFAASAVCTPYMRWCKAIFKCDSLCLFSMVRDVESFIASMSVSPVCHVDNWWQIEHVG